MGMSTKLCLESTSKAAISHVTSDLLNRLGRERRLEERKG